jgi:hypothetical protein
VQAVLIAALNLGHEVAVAANEILAPAFHHVRRVAVVFQKRANLVVGQRSLAQFSP